MTKRTAAKHKIDRRMGEDIWGRMKSPLNGRRRSGPPGQAADGGRGRRKKVSDFWKHLRAKQKLKGYYGDLVERQFRLTYDAAQRMKGDTGANLIALLERRLDAVVFHGKLTPTIFSARQFVNHGHVTVNGKRVNIPSYRVQDGDVIAVRPASKEMTLIQDAIHSVDNRPLPSYLEADHEKLTVVFLRAPELSDVPYNVRMEPNLVVEYYAKN